MALDEKYIRKVNEDANAYLVRDYLDQETYVDCKDTVSNWCVAKVTANDEEKEEVDIHFDGWGQKYDETLPYFSNRIAPFRSYTTNYTGMKNISRRDELKYNFGELEAMKRDVEKWIKKEFDNFNNAQEATQFLRGQLYLFVDFLLSNCDEDNLKKDDSRDIVEFMEQVFKLIIKWLELFPSKYMKYYEVYKQNKKAYLVDTNIAIAASGNELISILCNCFNEPTRIQRSTKPLKLTDKELETDWFYEK